MSVLPRLVDDIVAFAQDKTTLEKVCSSITAATVLDQKQRWAAVTQVEQLGRVLSESLKQVR